MDRSCRAAGRIREIMSSCELAINSCVLYVPLVSLYYFPSFSAELVETAPVSSPSTLATKKRADEVELEGFGSS